MELRILLLVDRYQKINYGINPPLLSPEWGSQMSQGLLDARMGGG